jgi:hypothetical protein
LVNGSVTEIVVNMSKFQMSFRHKTNSPLPNSRSNSPFPEIKKSLEEKEFSPIISKSIAYLYSNGIFQILKFYRR